MSATNTSKRLLSMVYMAICAALIAVCSWIAVPMTVPFTLQTFGVFCTLGLLGGKRGTLAVLVYTLLGLVGAPVFAGFSGGAGVLFGATGGYIIGFIFTALVYWLITSLLGSKWWTMLLGMGVGLLLCYTFGTVWFALVYAQTPDAAGFAAAWSVCVLPFILPDLAKLAAAWVVCHRITRHISLD